MASQISNFNSKTNKDIQFIWNTGLCNIKKNDDADLVARNSINKSNGEILSFSSHLDTQQNIKKYCMSIGYYMEHRIAQDQGKQIKRNKTFRSTLSHNRHIFLNYTKMVFLNQP